MLNIENLIIFGIIILVIFVEYRFRSKRDGRTGAIGAFFFAGGVFFIILSFVEGYITLPICIIELIILVVILKIFAKTKQKAT